MSVDPTVFSEMAQIDISIVKPFLQGTEGYPEGRITDEVFALKYFVDTLGTEEVRKTVSKLGSDGKHDDILPKLQQQVTEKDLTQHRKDKEREEQAAKAKKSSGGVFGWLFKGKDADAEKEKEKEKEKEREREREKERELVKERERERKREKEWGKKVKPETEEHRRKHTHSSSGGHTDPNSPEKSNFVGNQDSNSSNYHEEVSAYDVRAPAEKLPPQNASAASSSPQVAHAREEDPSPLPPQAPGRGLPFNPQFSALEAQMMGHYNFQSTSNRAYSTRTEDVARGSNSRDDDFDAIFNEFVSKAKAEQ